jgi:hypothetical protein
MQSAVHIPHQLGIAKHQAKNLISGKPVIIPHSMMGAEAGEHIMLLKPQNARKLLTAYKKGKGMKIRLAPDEIHHTIHHGMGFKDIASKMFKKAMKNPTIRSAADEGAEYIGDEVGDAVGEHLGNPILGDMIGDMVSQKAKKVIKKRGKGSILDEKFSINDVKRTGKELFGKGSILDRKFSINDVKNTGKELFGKGSILDEKFSINDVKRTGKELFGRGKLKKGSAEAKAFMASIRSRKGGDGISGKMKNAFTSKKAIGGLKTVGHYAIPATTSALGGLAGTFVGGPMGGIAGSAAGSYAGDAINKKIGIGMKRARGRPRKVGGALASSSSAYQQVLRNNFSGLTLNSAAIDNAPVSNFSVNSKVKPSSTEMTLSPYQRMDSPAMNPFIPTKSSQVGGTSCGYGGRGLYTTDGRGLY